MRRVNTVSIPDGVRSIGEQWFKNSCVERVTIPASVTIIGKEAFFCCSNLRSITFAADSALERIGEQSFCRSGLVEI